MELEDWLKSEAVVESWSQGFRDATTPNSGTFTGGTVICRPYGGNSLWAEYREPYEGIRLIDFQLNTTIAPPRVMCRVWFYAGQPSLEAKISSTALTSLLGHRVNEPIPARLQGSWRSQLKRQKVEVVGVQFDVRLPDIFAQPDDGEHSAHRRIQLAMAGLASEFLDWADRAYRGSGQTDLMVDQPIEAGGDAEASMDSPPPASQRNAEGEWQQVVVTVYERNRANRQACLDHYGTSCQACGMSFGETYGELGTDFIHVHHEIPLHTMDGAQILDPVKDMKPLCPNCHSLVHQTNPVMPVAELRLLLESRRCQVTK